MTSLNRCKIFLVCSGCNLHHCAIYLRPDRFALLISLGDLNSSGIDCVPEYLDTFLGVDLNKRPFSCKVADYAPVSAGDVCHHRNIGETVLTGFTSSVTLFFELVDLDCVFLAVLCLEDQLSFVDLLTLDILRVKLVHHIKHLSGHRRVHRAAAVQPHDVGRVNVHLSSLCLLDCASCVAWLCRERNLCSVFEVA